MQLSHWISCINEDDLDLHTVLNLGTHPMKTATFRGPAASQEMSVSDSLVIQVGFYYASKPLLNGLPPPKTNMTTENPAFEDVLYFLLKMEIFQCHVSFEECIICVTPRVWNKSCSTW